MSETNLTEAEVVRTIRRLAATGSQEGVAVGIGDDCAVLEPRPGRRLVATTDLLLEDVHFRRRWAEPADIGWKAMAVNLSDIASMGARPRWALVALAVPTSSTPDEVEAFFEGALSLARQHAVDVVGGDTSAAPAGWLVNITLLGDLETEPRLRSGARPGDVVAVTGALGRSAAGLALLEENARADEPGSSLEAGTRFDLTDAHLRPQPRVLEGQWLGRTPGVTAMMDLSDGLAADLRRLTDESGAGASVRLDQLPIDSRTRQAAEALNRDPLDWATGGGEDYELLLTCEAAAFERLRDGLAEAGGVKLTAIGEITPVARGLRFLDARGNPARVSLGYQHFSAGRANG
jgi:thiamine-monophosphate kinase